MAKKRALKKVTVPFLPNVTYETIAISEIGDLPTKNPNFMTADSYEDSMIQQKRSPKASSDTEKLDRAQGHYFAPREVSDFANAVIPEFDVDPCAHPTQFIKAKEMIVGSRLTGVDGFNHVPKGGSCWLNPPSMSRIPTVKDLSVDVGINEKTGQPNPVHRRPLSTNYTFHPMTEWFDKYLGFWDIGLLDTLMIYTPSRLGSHWWTDLMAKSTIAFMFRQRPCCWIQQRDSEGDSLDPIQLTSPFTGAIIFLYTRDSTVVSRFEHEGTTRLQPADKENRGLGCLLESTSVKPVE